MRGIVQLAFGHLLDDQAREAEVRRFMVSGVYCFSSGVYEAVGTGLVGLMWA